MRITHLFSGTLRLHEDATTTYAHCPTCPYTAQRRRHRRERWRTHSDYGQVTLAVIDHILTTHHVDPPADNGTPV